MAATSKRASILKPEQWDLHYELIKQLYIVDNKSLKEVRAHMLETQKFAATYVPCRERFSDLSVNEPTNQLTIYSEAQYERQLKIVWQFRKNVKQKEYKFYKQETEKRDRHDGDPELYVNGKLIPQKRIKKAQFRDFAVQARAQALLRNGKSNISATLCFVHLFCIFSTGRSPSPIPQQKVTLVRQPSTTLGLFNTPLESEFWQEFKWSNMPSVRLYNAFERLGFFANPTGLNTIHETYRTFEPSNQA